MKARGRDRIRSMRFIHPTSLAFGCGTNALRLRAHIHQELLGSILPGRLGACAAAGLGGGGAPFAAASTIGWLPGVKRIIRVDSPPRCASRFTARPLGAERLPVDRLRVAPQPAGGSRAGFPGQRRGGRGQADERLGLGPGGSAPKRSVWGLAWPPAGAGSESARGPVASGRRRCSGSEAVRVGEAPPCLRARRASIAASGSGTPCPPDHRMVGGG